MMRKLRMNWDLPTAGKVRTFCKEIFFNNQQILESYAGTKHPIRIPHQWRLLLFAASHCNFKLIHTMGGGRSKQVAENECLWSRVSYIKAGDFLACEQTHQCVRCRTIPFQCWGLGRHKFSPDSRKWACLHFLCWPSRWSGLHPCHVRTQRTRDRRLALICISVFILCLVPSFLAVSPLYSASKSLHLIL